MAVLALMMVAALAAGDPDGVVATAPATTVDLGATAQPVAPSLEGAAQEAAPHGLSTDAQIDRWIAARSTAEAPWSEADAGPDSGSDSEREMHGEVFAGIGTGGYREVGASVTLPLGERGWLGLSYRQVENGYYHGGYGTGLDPSYSGYRGQALSPDKAEGASAFDSPFPRRGGPSRRYPLSDPNRGRED